MLFQLEHTTAEDPQYPESYTTPINQDEEYSEPVEPGKAITQGSNTATRGFFFLEDKKNLKKLKFICKIFGIFKSSQFCCKWKQHGSYLFEFHVKLRTLPKTEMKMVFFPKKLKNEDSNRRMKSLDSSVAGGDAYHYTTEDCLLCLLFTLSQMIASISREFEWQNPIPFFN